MVNVLYRGHVHDDCVHDLGDCFNQQNKAAWQSREKAIGNMNIRHPIHHGDEKPLLGRYIMLLVSIW